MFDTILTVAFMALFAGLAYGNRNADTNFTRFLFNVQMGMAMMNGVVLLHKLFGGF